MIRKICLILVFLGLAFSAGMSLVAMYEKIRSDVTYEPYVMILAMLLMAGQGYASSVMVNKPWGLLAGIVGVYGVLAVLICLPLGLWRFNLFSNTSETRMVYSSIITFLFIPPAMGFLVFSGFKSGRVAGWVGFFLGSVLYVIAQITTIWEPGVYAIAQKYNDLMQGLLVFLFPMTLTVVGKGSWRRLWRYGGLAIGAAGLLMLAGSLFFRILPGRGYVTLMFDLCWIVAMANYLTVFKFRGVMWILPVITFIVGSGVAGYHCYVDYLGVDTVAARRLLAEGLISTIFGLLGTGLLAAVVHRLERPQTVFNPEKPVEITCPGCGTKQESAGGTTHCANCRLAITSAFHTPVCQQCGYSIYMLQSDKCPECGTKTPWAKAVAPTPTSAMGS